MSEEINIVTGEPEEPVAQLPKRSVRRAQAKASGEVFTPEAGAAKVQRIRQVTLDLPEALYHDINVAREHDPRAKTSSTAEYAVYLLIAAVMAIQAAVRQSAEADNLVKPAAVMPTPPAMHGVSERLRQLRG